MKRRGYLKAIGSTGAVIRGAGLASTATASSGNYPSDGYVPIFVHSHPNVYPSDKYKNAYDLALKHVKNYLEERIPPIDFVDTFNLIGDDYTDEVGWFNPDDESRSNFHAAVPEWAQQKYAINLIHVPDGDYLGWSFADYDHEKGGVGYVSQSLPTDIPGIGDAQAIFDRFKTPIIMHEIFHMLGADHKHGRQEKGAWYNPRIYPSVMATGYTFDHNDKPDNHCEAWDQTVNWSDVRPRTRISGYTDAAVKRKILDAYSGYDDLCNVPSRNLWPYNFGCQDCDGVNKIKEGLI